MEINDNFERARYRVFEQLKKTNEMGRSQTMNKRNEKSLDIPYIWSYYRFRDQFILTFKSTQHQ